MRKLGSQSPRRRRRFVASWAATILALTAIAGSTAAHAPDPFFTSGPFGQNQVLQYRW